VAQKVIICDFCKYFNYPLKILIEASCPYLECNAYLHEFDIVSSGYLNICESDGISSIATLLF